MDELTYEVNRSVNESRYNYKFLRLFCLEKIRSGEMKKSDIKKEANRLCFFLDIKAVDVDDLVGAVSYIESLGEPALSSTITKYRNNLEQRGK